MARRETGIPDFMKLEELPETFLSKEEILLLMFNSCKNYKGNADKLKDALGILMMSQLYGYKVVKLIWNKTLIREVEEILNHKLTDIAYPETKYSERSVGLNIIKGMKQVTDNIEKIFNDMIYNRLKKPEQYKIIENNSCSL